MCSKASTIFRKEILEDYLNFRDNLKVLFNVLIDEVWKHCHITSNELSKNNLSGGCTKDSPFEIKHSEVNIAQNKSKSISK